MPAFIEELEEKIVNRNYKITKEEALKLYDEDLKELCVAANRIRIKCSGRVSSVCSIVNAKSGNCSENCKYCAQSAHWKTQCEKTPFIQPEKAAEYSDKAYRNSVSRISLVASGRGVSGKEFNQGIECFKQMQQKTPDMALCASFGIIPFEKMQKLAECGVTRYHHNLEAGKNFYANICTTHTYDERIETIKNAQKAGLEICCGGIIGMGETRSDRIDMALEIRDLNVQSVPINVLTPIPGTPLQDIAEISKEEVLKTIAIFRFVMPAQVLRCAAGRKKLGNNGIDAFNAGANALISGDFLTVSGSTNEEDIQMLKSLGYTIG